MRFGLLYEHQLPRPWTGESEHRLFKDALAQVELADQLGIDHIWEVEHHFLEEYAHSSAPEVFLAACAARTKNIRIGHGVVLAPPGYNHPARVAERIATMDHLSNGRVEFGTGRGSSTAEWAGFAIPSASETKPMWRESIEQIPRMWMDEPYEYAGKYFTMPKRNVLPKPYTQPHPPMWVACSSPQTFVEAGELGLGALCFTFGTPSEIAEAVKAYKAAIKRCTKPIGGYVVDHIAVTTAMFCLPDGDRARALYADAKVGYFTTWFFNWLDSIPRPKGMPKDGPIKGLPAATPAELQAGLAVGGRQVGAPEEIVEVIKMYEAIGVDQLIYAPLTLTLDQKYVLESIETFGKYVLPHFDKDPVHSTTRQREAALAVRAA